MVWVMGPAAVGKSAVAQTIAEDFAEVGHLGASFFFSRPNHRDNPETLIPTLIYQLAIKLPEYKQIITKRLGDDPTILHKNRRAQFRELVTEPFLFLKAKRHPVTASPPLIVIDGLDECSDQEAQCEFVELVSSVNHLPLLWLVCSRPEFHLKSIQSNPDFHLTCLREDLLIDDKEAQQDAQRLLQSEFKKIRRCYSNQLGIDWPPQEHVRCIAATASGHLGFTAFVLRFIGDKERGDPDSQLQICVRFIGGGRSRPGALNPLHALDLLYREIFSSIPIDYLGTAMRVLSLTILYPHDKLSAQDHANFLSLDRAAFYRSLQKLHSVLSIPSASEAHTAGLYVYHASFSDFLKDSNRSGRYAIDEGTAHLDIAVRSLQWQVTAREAALRACSRVNHVSLPLEWTGSRDADELKENLRSFSSRVGLIACCKVHEDLVPSILTALHEFPFSVLHKQEMEDSQTILPFINWLRSHELVRIFELE
ncbi:hypothetical protein AN958_06958 [Leucoagaricus sp. SymC.cos]|nr:hypothetical protein AN958_06958 [Leucoagaricus sp. SymC.cos]